MRRKRISPPTGRLTAGLDGITQKGEFQVDLVRFIRDFFGLERSPGKREWMLVGWTSFLTATSAAMLLAVLAWPPAGTALGLPAVLFALAALIAESQSVRLTSRAEVSAAALPIILSAVIYGPLAAVFVSIVSLLPSFERPYARWLTWTATRSITSGCAGIAAFAIQGSEPHKFGLVLGAVVAATLIEQGGSALLGAVTASLRGVSMREIRLAGAIFLAMPLYVPVAALLVYAYREISPWSVVLFLFPAFVAQKLYLLYREQRATSEELTTAITRQERAHLSFASALVATLDARDEYTAGHSAAVAVYARDIADRLGLSDAEKQLAHLAGLVHDIGKIGLPPGLLEKPGPLTAAERRLMEEHSEIGERILARVEDYEGIARIVRHHHERVDGMGYPDGLLGEDIPLVSRIISVADAYNAMTSDRTYRDAMPSRVARLRLAQAVESQFDTAVVAAFEAVLAGGTEAYRCGQREDFSLEVHEAEGVLQVAAS